MGNYVQISSAILCFVLYAYVIIAAVYFGISF
ncbi:cytochrome C oxidase assembly protein, partial [Bacillus cereus]